MQFHLEKNEDLTAVLKIGMATDDYAEKVERQIQEVRKTIQMPGFRKGNVPAGLIRKQYGQGILIEEVNKLLQEGINGYIKEQQLTLLGQPMPREKSDIDWSSELQEFEFDLGLAPEIKLNISEKKDKLPYRQVDITDALVDDEIDSLRRRYGKVEQVEEVGPADFVRGQCTEKGKEDGHTHSAGFRLDEERFTLLSKKLTGAKKDDEVELDVKADFAQPEDAAQALGMDSAHLETHGAQWNFKIEGIIRVEPAEMTAEDLFEKVHKGVTEEAEFRSKVSEQLQASFSGDAERMFQNAMIEYLLERENIPLPDAFLRKWMVSAHEGAEPMTDEQVGQEYPAMAKGIRWQLIETSVAEQEELKVENEDLQEAARALVREQMAAYGQQMMDPALVDSIAQNYMNDGDKVSKLYEKAMQTKVLEHLSAKFGKKVESVSVEDFYNQPSH
ncbi:MAG: trigger factor [Flavobacteriia bacterium]|nr:trigger factor [Flavobacteriia bacterium]